MSTTEIAGQITRHGGQILIWDSRRPLASPLRFGTHSASIDWVHFSTDSKRIFTACYGRGDDSPPLLNVWDFRRQKLVRQIKPRTRAFRTPLVDPTQRTAIWLGLPKNSDPKASDPQETDASTELASAPLEVWNLKTGKLRWSLDRSDLQGVAVTSDGKLLIGSYKKLEPHADGKPGIRIAEKGFVAWRLESGREEWRRPISDDHFRPDEFLFVLPGDGRLAALQPGGVRLWNIETGELDRTIEVPGFEAATTAALSDDGSRLAFVHFGSHALEVWNIDEPRSIVRIEVPDQLLFGRIAFSPNLDRVLGEIPKRSSRFMESNSLGTFELPVE